MRGCAVVFDSSEFNSSVKSPDNDDIRSECNIPNRHLPHLVLVLQVIIASSNPKEGHRHIIFARLRCPAN
jgi:hypothetical protein